MLTAKLADHDVYFDEADSWNNSITHGAGRGKAYHGVVDKKARLRPWHTRLGHMSASTINRIKDHSTGIDPDWADQEHQPDVADCITCIKARLAKPTSASEGMARES
jgi:hypothetical protein